MSYIDTRDLHDRLAELEEISDEEISIEEDREREELREMESSITDWRYGETLIPEDEFEEYARDLAEDIGAVPSDLQWPATYIDWPRAADALRMDYTEYEYEGTTYLAR